MRNVIVLVALALSGCASLDIQRKVYDERGRELTNVSVRHPLATSEGAALLMEQGRRLEETKQDGDAERRTSQIAEKSVEKGQPTTVATRGGNVQSGYVGYGAYGYDPYGYDQYGYGQYGYGGYGPAVYYPGTDSRMVQVEAMWRRGQYLGLPPLGEPVVPFSPQQAATPDASYADPNVQKDLRDLRTDVDEFVRTHRSKHRK
jgi:hypothetical protein